ncbi:Transposable element Tc3 transposase [Fusarium oxysporum f. sp. albedinis]|nr:Transposable element Tc3 transposase [Fusarium oxysporum f. sp. albedinis]
MPSFFLREDLWEEADSFIRQAIIALLARSPSDCPKEPSPDLIALLVREGAMEASEPTLEKIRKKPPIDITRLENTSYLGRKWLGVLPTKKDLSFTDSEITKALRSRLFYSIKPPSLPYSSCGAIAALGYKDTYKGASRRWIPSLEVEKEPLVNKETSLWADLAITLGISRSLRAFFQPIIISAGPLAATQLNATIGLTLTRTRAILAASIAKEIPAGLARSVWNTSRRSS